MSIPPLAAAGRPLPTKVVLRLLPPVCEPEQVDQVEWSSFVPGKRPDKPTPENPVVNSRMYLQFKTFQAACEAINKYHGKVMGESYRAVAAFAPVQRVPKPGRQLVNNLDGTYQDSDHYKSFIENGPVPFVDQSTVNTVKKDVAPLVAAIAERNRRLNEQIEARRATTALKKKPKATAEQSEPKTTAKNAKKAPKVAEKPKAAAPKPQAGAPPPPPPPPVKKAAAKAKPGKQGTEAPKILKAPVVMKRSQPNP